MLGRGFLKQQEMVRTIQFGISRVIPFSETSTLKLMGERAGEGKYTKSEYRWGAELPLWGKGVKKGYIDKYAQPFFQYFDGGTDYWGWYKRHSSEVWGDARKTPSPAAGWPALYGQGKQGDAFKKTVGVKSGGKVGSFGNLTEDDIKFKSATIGDQMFHRPALKGEGGGSKGWSSGGDSWWKKYGNVAVGDTKEAMKELWTAFFQYAEEGMGEVGLELDDGGKSALLKKTINQREKYKVWNPTSKRMVSIAEAAGEVDLAMIINDNATDAQSGGLPYQMVNANPGLKESEKGEHKVPYTATGKGQDWIFNDGKGYRKDLDFSTQFAEGQVMKSVLEQKGVVFPDNFEGFEVSMFEITHESRILHLAKDSLGSIDDIAGHLKTVESALNKAVGVVDGAALSSGDLVNAMKKKAENYESMSGKAKSGLSVMDGTTAALTGQETQQILSRLTVGGLNNNFGPSSYAYEAGLNIGGESYSIIIMIGTEDTNGDGIPDRIFTRLAENGAIELAAGRRGIREVIGQEMLGANWTSEKSAEYMERAGITYFMSNLAEESIGRVYETLGHIAAGGMVNTPVYGMASMTSKQISDSLIEQFEAFTKNTKGNDAFSQRVAQITESATKEWLNSTNWGLWKGQSFPERMFNKKNNYSHPTAVDMGFTNWGEMAKRNFYASPSSIARGDWSAKGQKGKGVPSQPTGYTGGWPRPIWSAPFFSASRKMITKAEMGDRIDV